MAWINVHEDMIGSRLRKLAKCLGCSQNESIGLLVRLWLWGINNADKEGKIEGISKEEIAGLLMVGRCKELDPEKAVDSLIESGWLLFDGDTCRLTGWHESQKLWYKLQNDKAQNTRRQREYRERRKRVGESKIAVPHTEIHDAPAMGERAGKEEQKETVSKKEKVPYSTDFEEFWKIYPRKEGKGEAYKKYKARLNDGWKPEELRLAAENYSSQIARDRTETKYIKHAKTFLSDSTPFEDYLSKPEQPKPEEPENEESQKDPLDNPFR